MQEESGVRPSASVTFTKSSSKDGGRGYTVHVEAGATDDEIQGVMVQAIRLREQAEQEVAQEG